MADPIDLSGDIVRAIDGAYNRGAPVAVAYVDAENRPSLSLRGSAQVLNDKQIALWARSTDTGLAKAIETNPYVSLIFFGPIEGGDKMLLSIKGKARADASQSRTVYDAMIENERKFDPEAKGIAVVVDVEHVTGMTANGGFAQSAGA